MMMNFGAQKNKKEAVKKALDPLCGKTLLGRVNIQQSAPPIVVTEDAGVDSKDDNGDELS